MATILIADDDREIVELLKVPLQKDAHTIEAVYHGNEVLRKIRTSAFDLIILDIMLPGIDGYNIQLEITNSDQNRNTPVIIITALEPARVLFEKFPQVKAYFIKPFAVEELHNKVTEILGQR